MICQPRQYKASGRAHISVRPYILPPGLCRTSRRKEIYIMAINLASKYEKKVSERFSLGSLTDKHVGKDYDFIGVKSIKVWAVDTVPLSDYTRNGTSRFGELTELGDTVQELGLTQDKGFTFSIDAGNASEQFNVKQANASLKREIDEVITPTVDAYRLNAWASGNGLSDGNAVLSSVDGAPAKNTILEWIFNAGAAMSDEKVPRAGRTLFISEQTFVKFKLSDVVLGGGDKLTEENVKQGYKGTIDGMAVVTVPGSMMPENVNFIIKHKNATVDPMKLKNYRVHKNPMGVDGDVVEGRIIYDSFVLDSKCKGVYVSKSA